MMIILLWKFFVKWHICRNMQDNDNWLRKSVNLEPLADRGLLFGGRASLWKPSIYVELSVALSLSHSSVVASTDLIERKGKARCWTGRLVNPWQSEARGRGPWLHKPEAAAAAAAYFCSNFSLIFKDLTAHICCLWPTSTHHHGLKNFSGA